MPVGAKLGLAHYKKKQRSTFKKEENYFVLKEKK